MIAFAVSRLEAAVVNAIPANEDGFPYISGALFYFRPKDVAAFLDALHAYQMQHEFAATEFQAASRLAGRLGTWKGRAHVAVKVPVVHDEPEAATDNPVAEQHDAT